MNKDRLRALLVDDEPSFRKVLRTSLATSGFVVHEVTCGEEALEILAERSFDMVLLDLNMPGMGGIETCREIRTVLPKVGIVMVTVRDAESDMVKAFECGADDYLTKPIRFREMVARLRAVWRRLHIDDEKPDVLRVGDLELDMNQRVLHRNGDCVHLTPTEFRLLALLMRSEGVPVPHAKLLRSIWGPEYSSELEYLRSYVKALRKKIELDPSQPKYILTEPWFGYRMCNPSVAVYGTHVD
jgi:two-component system, OmpR family, KDP operon response regulator KdpE